MEPRSLSYNISQKQKSTNFSELKTQNTAQSQPNEVDPLQNKMQLLSLNNIRPALNAICSEVNSINVDKDIDAAISAIELINELMEKSTNIENLNNDETIFIARYIVNPLQEKRSKGYHYIINIIRKNWLNSQLKIAYCQKIIKCLPNMDRPPLITIYHQYAKEVAKIDIPAAIVICNNAISQLKVTSRQNPLYVLKDSLEFPFNMLRSRQEDSKLIEVNKTAHSIVLLNSKLNEAKAFVSLSLHAITSEKSKDFFQQSIAIQIARSHLKNLEYLLNELERYNPPDFKELKTSVNAILVQGHEKINVAQEALTLTINLETLKAARLDMDVDEIASLSKKYAINFTGSSASFVGLLNFGLSYQQYTKKLGVNDIDGLILSDDPFAVVEKLVKEDKFVASVPVYENNEFKYINLIKKTPSGRDLDITIRNPKTYRVEFITGFNSVKFCILDKPDHKNYTCLPINHGLYLCIDKHNPFNVDFEYACQTQKLLVAKYNPYLHTKYCLTTLKNYKKMKEIFGYVKIKSDKNPDPKVAGDGKTELIHYQDMLDGLSDQFFIALASKDKKRQNSCFLEINPLLKKYGIMDLDVQPYLQSLICAMIRFKYPEKYNDSRSLLLANDTAAAVVNYLQHEYKNDLCQNIKPALLRTRLDDAIKKVTETREVKKTFPEKKEIVRPNLDSNDTIIFCPVNPRLTPREIGNLPQLYKYDTADRKYYEVSRAYIHRLIRLGDISKLYRLCIPQKVSPRPLPALQIITLPNVGTHPFTFFTPGTQTLIPWQSLNTNVGTQPTPFFTTPNGVLQTPTSR